MSYRAYFCLAIIACVLSYGTIYLFKYYYPDFEGDWLWSAPSGIAVFWGIYTLIDKWLRKYKWVQFLLWIDRENLNWERNGELKSTYWWPQGTTLQWKIRIRQTLSNIIVNGEFGQSQSRSLCAMIYKQNDETVLHYNYDNIALHGSTTTMNDHKGFCTLNYKIENGKKVLNWQYTTSRERDNHGTIKVELL